MTDYFDKFDSIIAVSTGNYFKSAISVIRISGPIEPDALLPYLSCSAPIEPRKAIFTKLLNNNETLDEIVLTYFKGPSSFTGENVFELSVHGNPINVNRIIDFLTKELNLRSAEAGEFSYRALRNKKLSLNQIEGLDLILSSNSDFAISQGLNLLSGDVNSDYTEIKKAYLYLCSTLEVVINFSEDLGEKEAFDIFKDSFESFKNLIEKLKERAPIEPEILIKPKIVLYGKPNSGKSTLFNRLLKKKRSIVSSTEGTTRDYIADTISIKGVSFELIDTAGIRSTEDEIEEAGIEFSKNLLDKAFFKILLTKDDIKDDSFDLVIKTHSDFGPMGPLEDHVSRINGPIGANLLEKNTDFDNFVLSSIINKFEMSIENNPIIIPRHNKIINELYNISNNFNNLVDIESDFAILSSEVGSMGALLEELIGQVKSDDVLDNIFANFCIGK